MPLEQSGRDNQSVNLKWPKRVRWKRILARRGAGGLRNKLPSSEDSARAHPPAITCHARQTRHPWRAEKRRTARRRYAQAHRDLHHRRTFSHWSRHPYQMALSADRRPADRNTSRSPFILPLPHVLAFLHLLRHRIPYRRTIRHTASS